MLRKSVSTTVCWSGWARRSGSCRASRLDTHGCGTAPEFDRLLRDPSRQGADHTDQNDVKRDAPRVVDRQLVSAAKLAEVEGATLLPPVTKRHPSTVPSSIARDAGPTVAYVHDDPPIQYDQ